MNAELTVMRRWRLTLIAAAFAFGMVIPLVIGISFAPEPFADWAISVMVSLALAVASMFGAIQIDSRIPDHGDLILLREAR